MQTDLLDLVRMARTGDAAAFDRIVERHDRKAFQVAYGILGSVEDAQDVVQDAFVLAYQRLDSYSFDGHFSGWMNRIVVRQALNRRKQRARKRWFSFNRNPDSNSANEAMMRAHDQPDPNRLLESREIGETVNRLLDDLPDQQRTVFVLRHMHEHKLSEIAEILGCAEGTVKNQLFRATQKIRKQMTRKYDERH